MTTQQNGLFRLVPHIPTKRMSLNQASLKHSMNFSLLLLIALALIFNPLAIAQDAAETSQKIDETQVIASDEEDKEATTPEEKKAPLSPSLPALERLTVQQKRLLSELQTPPTPVWINLNDKQLLGFWQNDLSGHPYGAVLLLHDAGDSPLSPRLMNLHRHLPLEGWATLSLELPKPVQMEPPPRPTPSAPPISEQSRSEEGQEASENSEITDETQVVYDDKTENKDMTPPKTDNLSTELAKAKKPSAEEALRYTLDSIQAGINYLQQQGQYNIIILGEGLGGLQALQYTQANTSNTPPTLAPKESKTNTTAVIERSIRALILLDIQNTYTGQKEAASDLLNDPKTPTLDIYTKNDTQSRMQAKKRKVLAQKNGMAYRLKRLPPNHDTPSATKESRLTKVIRGFLNRFAKGKEF